MAPKRDKNGHFLPGESGNTKGGKTKFPEAREALARGLPSAIEYLLDVVTNDANEPKDRIAAAKVVMDFGLPKPRNDHGGASAALLALAEALAEPE